MIEGNLNITLPMFPVSCNPVLVLELQRVPGLRGSVLGIVGDGGGWQAAAISTLVSLMRRAAAGPHHGHPSPQPVPCQPQPWQPHLYQTLDQPFNSLLFITITTFTWTFMYYEYEVYKLYSLTFEIKWILKYTEVLLSTTEKFKCIDNWLNFQQLLNGCRKLIFKPNASKLL